MFRLTQALDLAKKCQSARRVGIGQRGRFELGAGLGFKREEFEGFGAPFKERGGRRNR
jgi:hypothetical protein